MSTFIFSIPFRRLKPSDSPTPPAITFPANPPAYLYPLTFSKLNTAYCLSGSVALDSSTFASFVVCSVFTVSLFSSSLEFLFCSKLESAFSCCSAGCGSGWVSTLELSIWALSISPANPPA